MQLPVLFGVLVASLLLAAPATASGGLGHYRDTSFVVWDLSGEKIEFEVEVESIYFPVALDGDRFAWMDRPGRGAPVDVFVHTLGSEEAPRLVATLPLAGIRDLHLWGDNLFIHSVTDTRSGRVQNIDRVDLATLEVERVLERAEIVLHIALGGPYAAWTEVRNPRQHDPSDLHVYDLVARETVFDGISPAEIGLTPRITLLGVTETWLIAMNWSSPFQDALYSFDDGSVRNISHYPRYEEYVSVASGRIAQWSWTDGDEQERWLTIESWRLEDGGDWQAHHIEHWPTLQGAFFADGESAILYAGVRTIPGPDAVLALALLAVLVGLARRGGLRSPECRHGRGGR